MQNVNGGRTTRLTVLLADHDGAAALLLERALRRLKILDRLMVVPDGAEALACLEGSGQYADRLLFPFPNILFVEHRIPVLSGVSLLCCLRSEPRFECLPVVILSARFSLAQLELAARLRAACCAKTAAPAAILESITQSIRRALGVGQDSRLPALEEATDESGIGLPERENRHSLPLELAKGQH